MKKVLSQTQTQPRTQTISAWGRLNAPLHHVIALTDCEQAATVIQSSTVPGLAHGMGRSYGDVGLNPEGVLWRTLGLDRFMAFDAQTGRLTCETGVLLRDIQRLFVPRGWILPVTPGTQLLTVGGAIANDVHGKNHHAQGSFGDHVQSLTLARTDGTLLTCSPQQQPNWFAATIGGMGLTGVVLQASLQLRRVPSPWLDTETLAYHNLDEFFELADTSEAHWEHTVSWIDCLSGSQPRGLFMRGNPMPSDGRPDPAPKRTKNFPRCPPFSLVNRLSLRLFNTAYFHLKQKRARRCVTHYEPFFYPLDALSGWNRMYGRTGFYQYQSVVPRNAGREATQAMLHEITRSGQGSFLGVLKTFGNRQAVGMMSFPQPGVTLALDFPNLGGPTLTLFERLDAIVREVGGRIYPAKDARMPRSLFEAGYPRLAEFSPYRDPGIRSGLSRRLMD